jgi:hypothetical protein
VNDLGARIPGRVVGLRRGKQQWRESGGQQNLAHGNLVMRMQAA